MTTSLGCVEASDFQQSLQAKLGLTWTNSTLSIPFKSTILDSEKVTAFKKMLQVRMTVDAVESRLRNLRARGLEEHRETETQLLEWKKRLLREYNEFSGAMRRRMGTAPGPLHF